MAHRFTAVVIMFVIIGAAQALGGRAALAQTTNSNPGNEPGAQLFHPDQYNVNECERYFRHLREGLWNTPYDESEMFTYKALCAGRTADLASSSSNRTLPGSFIRAVVESNQFDTPGYDRIAISGATVAGDVDLSKIHLRNVISLSYMKFLGSLDLSYSSSDHILEIRDSTFPLDAGLCMQGFQTTQSVLVDGFKLSDDKTKGRPYRDLCLGSAGGEITLDFGRIEGLVYIHRAKLNAVSATSARIAGDLSVWDSNVFRALHLESVSVGGEVSIVNDGVSVVSDFTGQGLSEPSCADGYGVFLEDARVSGSIQLSRSTFCKALMTGVHVQGGLKLLGSTLSSFDFTGSTAGGDLQIGPAPTPEGELRAISWRHKKAQPDLVLSHSTVGLVRVAYNNWPSPGAASVDATHPGDAKLPDGPLKACSNTDTGDVQKSQSWLSMALDWVWGNRQPPNRNDPRLIIADFRFTAFGAPLFIACAENGAVVDDIPNSVALQPDKLESWLRSAVYSPVEFEIVQNLLRASGQEGGARRIGFVGKMIETDVARKQGSYGSWIAMTSSRWFIGYGYCPWVAGLWAVVLWLIGALVFVTLRQADVRVKDGDAVYEAENALPKEGRDKLTERLRNFARGRLTVIKYETGPSVRGVDYGKVSPLLYSFDVLLPVIKLRDIHYDIDILSPKKWYFYGHRAMGYVLGIFVLAAISGLTH